MVIYKERRKRKKNEEKKREKWENEEVREENPIVQYPTRIKALCLPQMPIASMLQAICLYTMADNTVCISVKQYDRPLARHLPQESSK